jgi:hypothetical protein
MDNIYLHAEEMIYIWKEKGRLSNEDMDRLNICKSPVEEAKSEASTLKKAKLLQDARDLVGAH